MFELNLIKDKAKARQRRRVIFLSVVCILFLSGLTAIFVGSLYWNETTKLNKAKGLADELAKKNEAMNNDLAIREPKSLKRRNGLIEAWRESMAVHKDRKFFSPGLKEIMERRPAGQFWYRSINITVVRQGGPGETLKGEDLLGPRGLLGGGYVQIEGGAETLTQRELDARSGQMTHLTSLVGQPKFTLNMDRQDTANRQSRPGEDENKQFVDFTISAAMRVFTGGGGSQP
ncbi:MAG: hypothetical protein HS108_13945 [Planctomycetes bacterium]|jgi:hypothetical protein|nr:hypothetical protein [Planctomycetota bacterium]MCL4730283.1 hypothetical protein [Planctomycetota bacterium]